MSRLATGRMWGDRPGVVTPRGEVPGGTKDKGTPVVGGRAAGVRVGPDLGSRTNGCHWRRVGAESRVEPVKPRGVPKGVLTGPFRLGDGRWG